eukprot:NODE_248_length_12985_cov_0.286357.p3 type:complete len:332 gc:universal NODE_248_length_12985_cov_0.286357:10680-9685(-)
MSTHFTFTIMTTIVFATLEKIIFSYCNMREVVLEKSFDDKIIKSIENIQNISNESIRDWITGKEEELAKIIQGFIHSDALDVSPIHITKHINADQKYLNNWDHDGKMERFLEVFLCKKLTELNIWVKLVVREDMNCSIIIKKVSSTDLKFQKHSISVDSVSANSIVESLVPYSFILVQRYKFKNEQFPKAVLKFDNATYKTLICYSVFTVTVLEGDEIIFNDFREAITQRSKIIQDRFLYDEAHYKLLENSHIIEPSYKQCKNWLFPEQHIWEQFFQFSKKEYFKQLTVFKDTSDEVIDDFKQEVERQMSERCLKCNMSVINQIMFIRSSP